MEQKPDHPAGAQDNAPLDRFSDCHAGIVGQLHALDRLPALVDAAAEARRIAGELQRFFDHVIVEHHAQEEKSLFPAVMAAAVAGEEREQVRRIVERLTAEHREVEAAWRRLVPALKAIAKGRDATLPADGVHALVSRYEGHARFEEREFLPLSEQILGRDGHQMAALGLSLHMRDALPEALARFRRRI